MAGRAKTDQEKREIIERLYRAWCASPHLRLGQLISNALVSVPTPTAPDLFYREDDVLARDVDQYAGRAALAKRAP